MDAGSGREDPMVALRAEQPARPVEQSRIQPRTRAAERQQPFEVLEGRKAARKPVALRAWVMTMEGAARGYALDLSEGGCRLGGMGTRFQVGQKLLCKIELSPAEAPVVIRAHVARYHLVAATDGYACPELCLRFSDVNLDEWFRIARFLDALRA